MVCSNWNPLGGGEACHSTGTESSWANRERAWERRGRRRAM